MVIKKSIIQNSLKAFRVCYFPYIVVLFKRGIQWEYSRWTHFYLLIQLAINRVKIVKFSLILLQVLNIISFKLFSHVFPKEFNLLLSDTVLRILNVFIQGIYSVTLRYIGFILLNTQLINWAMTLIFLKFKAWVGSLHKAIIRFNMLGVQVEHWCRGACR